jgi:hypothetical protein
MSVEERLRAAARARTDVVSGVRPLELPDELPAPARRTRHASRWFSWGAPIAAAALVTALALTLALLRQAGGPRPGPSVPASGASAASIPRYYVELAYTGSTSAQMKAIVGDDRTGRKVAVLNPTASQNFYGVTAAADDRTFVVMNYRNTTQQTTWYLLRIAPGTAHPARMVKLPIKPLVAHVSGLALSPDGRELAIMYRTATTATNAKTFLTVYSMSSGAALNTWRTNGPNNGLIGGDGNGAGLSWVHGDRSVDFRWQIPPVKSKSGMFTPGRATLRALDVTAGGHDLMADSGLVVQLPMGATHKQARTWTEPCANALAAGDGTVVCGPAGGSYASGVEARVLLSFASLSAATGKPKHVLYTYQDQVLNANFEVLWTDPAGSRAITLLLLALKGEKVPASDKFGVVGGGRFTPLPALIVPSGAVDNAGGIAF